MTNRPSVIIVGAGAFGLSTAIHLLEAGYTQVTVFDGQDLDRTAYSPFKGADSASSDTMKVIRSAYGAESVHTQLANEAIAGWRAWNSSAEASGSTGPLFVNNGWTRMHSSGQCSRNEIETQETLRASGLSTSQYRITDSDEQARAVQDGWAVEKLDVFGRSQRGMPVDGVLDGLAGFVHADKACQFALGRVRALGGKVVLGSHGMFADYLYGSERRRALGIITLDGVEHRSDFVIVAAGAKSHNIVPGLSAMATTTGANIVHVQIPERLQARFKPDVFPVFSWDYTGADEDEGLSGFPIDEHGTLKFLYRSPRWSNLVPNPSSNLEDATSQSIPWDPETRVNVPRVVIDTVKRFISENLPELVGCDIRIAKLCWDSFTAGLDFVIDWVPTVENLMVVTGGSGHGFKFLPTLGKHVIDVLERRQSPVTDLWRWKSLSADEKRSFKDSVKLPKRRLDLREKATVADLSWPLEESVDTISKRHGVGQRTYIITLKFPILPSSEILSRISYGGDVWEFRADLLKGPRESTETGPMTLSFLQSQLTYLQSHASSLPILFTVRSVSQGGRWPDPTPGSDSEALLLRLIKLAIEFECAYIDVEIDWPSSLINAIRGLVQSKQGARPKIVASWHETTGAIAWDSDELAAVLERASQIGDIPKVCMYAPTIAASHAMALFVSAHPRYSVPGHPLIAITTGPHGKLSRFSNPVTFVTHPLIPQLPGSDQLTLKHVNTALYLLGELPKKTFEIVVAAGVDSSKVRAQVDDASRILRAGFEQLGLPHELFVRNEATGQSTDVAADGRWLYEGYSAKEFTQNVNSYFESWTGRRRPRSPDL